MSKLNDGKSPFHKLGGGGVGGGGGGGGWGRVNVFLETQYDTYTWN